MGLNSRPSISAGSGSNSFEDPPTVSDMMAAAICSDLASSATPPLRAALTWSASMSAARSRVATTVSVASTCDERIWSSRVSNTWLKRTRGSRPKAPPPPFTECTARNTELMVSESVAPCSMASSPSSSWASSSSHSMKKVTRMASIGSTDMIRPPRA